MPCLSYLWRFLLCSDKIEKECEIDVFGGKRRKGDAHGLAREVACQRGHTCKGPTLVWFLSKVP